GVGEKGLKPVVVSLQYRIEFMVVTSGAAISETREHGPDGVRDVVEDLLAPLHQIAGVTFIRIMPVEGRGHAGIGIVRPQLIAGDLLADEAVVRLVGVESFDDIVAVTPGVRTRLVALEAFAFRIAGQFQPVTGPTLSVVW